MDNPSKYWTIPVQNQNHSCPESEQHPSKKWTGLGGKGEILKKEKDLNNFSFLKSNPSDSWTGQATELPQNFMADEGNINLAKQKGINLELSLPKFKAHHKTKRTFSHDWQAQLEYWLLNAPSPVIQYKEGNSSEDLSEEEKLKKKFTFLSRSLGKDINVQVTNFLREVNFDEIPQHERDSCFQRYLMGQK